MNEELPANHAKERQKKNLVDDLIFKEEAYDSLWRLFACLAGKKQ